MNTSTFFSLAPELVQAIGEELDVSSMKNLRLTCKQFGKYLGPLILCKITIDLVQDTIDRDMPKLRAFASKDSAVSQDTRVITIHALSPTFDPNYRGENFAQLDFIPEVPTKALEAEDELKASLHHSLTSLKGVYKLRWSPSNKDKEWAQTIVIDALKDFPNLRVLELDLTNCNVPINLEEIIGLNSIFIEDSRSGEILEKTLQSLPKMITKSPQLTSINVLPCRRYGEVTPQSHSLHHLFQNYPKDTPPLRLLHLGLNGCFFRIDNTTMPHLTSLKSFRLTSLVDPFAPPVFFNSEDKNHDREVEKGIGNSAGDIWKALESTDIRLEAIKHNNVTSSFLNYISIYCGLKKLDLEPDSWTIDVTISNSLAVQFFADSLSNHVQTLEELHIKPQYEGAWSFSLHTLPYVSKCVNLRKLGLSIISAELTVADGAEDSNSEDTMKVDIIKQLIDMAVAHLPRLEALTIFPANAEDLRHATCGNSSISHFYHAHSTMVESVKNYTAPSSSERLPQVVITKRSMSSKQRDEVFIGKTEFDQLCGPRLIYVSDNKVDSSLLS